LAIAGHRGVRLRVLSNPLDRVMLGNETLDYFRFAIRPQNITPQPDPGFFRATKVGRFSDMRRIT